MRENSAFKDNELVEYDMSYHGPNVISPMNVISMLMFRQRFTLKHL